MRYGVISLMANFLDESHIQRVFAALRNVKHDGYYVKMALAWLYATAAVHFFEPTLSELENGQIDAWTRNKSYQKCASRGDLRPSSKRLSQGRKEWQIEQQAISANKANFNLRRL